MSPDVPNVFFNKDLALVANWETSMMRGSADNFRSPSASHPILMEAVRRLIDVYHPLRIYLFGSAARGDAGPDSDYDLMVVGA